MYVCTHVHVIVVLWFSKVTLEKHSTADLYYDAVSQTLGSVFPTTSTMLFYAAGVYELSRVHGMGFVL